MAVTRFLGVLTLLLVCAGGACASVARTFSDVAGDGGDGPDIRKVEVASDAALVTFAIRASSAASWQDAAAILSLDTDASQATGDAGGFELSYVLHSNHDALTLDESNGVHLAQPAATWRLDGPVLTITAPRAELRAGATIGFRVRTLAAGGDDTAPEDGAASWRFSPDAVPLSLAASFTSSAPRHGRAFALVHVSASFSDGTRGFAPATCTAKLGRTALRPGCHWRAPAKARGLRLAIVVRAAGLRRAYSFRVR